MREIISFKTKEVIMKFDVDEALFLKVYESTKISKEQECINLNDEQWKSYDAKMLKSKLLNMKYAINLKNESNAEEIVNIFIELKDNKLMTNEVIYMQRLETCNNYLEILYKFLTNNELDLFTNLEGLTDDNLHPKFKFLKDNEISLKYERKVLKSWTKGFIDRDNKIIKEFQTTFHSAFWEFYLFAVLKKIGLEIDFTQGMPDFMVKKPEEFYIEAVVAKIKNSGKKEDERTIEDQISLMYPPHFQDNFSIFLDEAITRASNSFLVKVKAYRENYQKLRWVNGKKPYVIAISSFDQVNYGREHIYSMLALLYNQYYDSDNQDYVFKNKIIKPDSNAEIKLGMFSNNDYSDVSAIIFTCTLTLGKLTSHVLSNGEYSMNNVNIIRRCFDDDKVPYKLQKISSTLPEHLEDGLFIFHNPYAKNKLNLDLFEFSNITQFYVDEGALRYPIDTYPLVARINYPKILEKGYKEVIEEGLRAFNNKNYFEFYDFEKV